MDMLIVEDVMLLLLDDATGTVPGSSNLHLVLGGAVLIELALTEKVMVEPDRSRWRSPRVFPVPGAPVPADPLLAGALGLIAAQPRTATDLVDRLGRDLRDHVAQRLANRGMVQLKTGKVLGLFPTTSWPALDPSHEQELRGTLDLVLARGATPDARTAAVIALMNATDLLHRVFGVPGVHPKVIRARGKEIAQGQWAAKAVTDAIAAANAAVMASIAAATAATTAATTS